MKRMALLAGVAIGAGSVGCAGTPAAPFDTLKNAPTSAYRLQNFEPPPTAAVPVPTPAGPGAFPLPPEVAAWAKMGASMLPPGLLPPGILPGTAPPTPAPTQPQMDTTPRFQGFRILGQATVNDDAKKEIIDILGFESSFDSSYSPCLYPEFGFSFQRMGQPPADVLVSLACDQVEARGFVWPHKVKGLTPDSQKKIAKIVAKIWGSGG